MPNITKKTKTKINKTKNNNNNRNAYYKCKKTHCSNELKLDKKINKMKSIKLKKLKCNYDVSQNYKFDKYNQITVKYDYNPFHFPYNKIKTSPCIKDTRKLLNQILPGEKCADKYCKKESKKWLGI